MTDEELDCLITDILEGKRCVPVKVRNDLMFTMVATMYRDIKSITARVAKVEQASIVMWMEHHPKAALTIIAAILTFLTLWTKPEFRHPVQAAFGLPQQ
jgi:hypothetical protein